MFVLGTKGEEHLWISPSLSQVPRSKCVIFWQKHDEQEQYRFMGSQSTEKETLLLMKISHITPTECSVSAQRPASQRASSTSSSLLLRQKGEEFWQRPLSLT